MISNDSSTISSSSSAAAAAAGSPSTNYIQQGADSTRHQYYQLDVEQVNCKPLNCILLVPRDIPPADEIQPKFAEWGGFLIFGPVRYRLSMMGTKKLGRLLSDKSWFSGYEPSVPDGEFTKFEATCRVPLLLQKWASSLNRSVSHHRDGVRPDKVQIDYSYAVHEITHFGEIAHSLRYALRGGHITWVSPGDAAERLRKSNITESDLTQMTSKKFGIKGLSSKRYNEARETLRKQYAPTLEEATNRFRNLHDNLQFDAGLKVLCGEGHVHNVFEWQLLRSTSSYQPYNHTDLHLAQVPDDPQEFLKQLLTERSLQKRIESSENYDAIKEEVIGRLNGQKFDLIFWNRNVEVGNREVTKGEKDGCKLGALDALKRRRDGRGSMRVLDLGDTGAVTVGDFALLGVHVSPDGAPRRTLLQQLQFLRAVVSVSGAKLLVSERTGLADLVSLAGGIPMCQFVCKSFPERNERLTDVHISGCRMGFTVWPWKDDVGDDCSVVYKHVLEGCTHSLNHDELLTRELQTFENEAARAAK